MRRTVWKNSGHNPPDEKSEDAAGRQPGNVLWLFKIFWFFVDTRRYVEVRAKLLTGGNVHRNIMDKDTKGRPRNGGC